MVLTADKGVALVIMDTTDYKKKAEELLQQPTYQPIPTDPTSKYKNKLINMLKSIRAEGGISEAVYKKLYPTGAGSPKFYGLPKIHKEGMPLRPIVSSIGAVTYYTSKELVKDPQTIGRKVTIPHTKQPRFHTTDSRHPTATQPMYGVI